jgi:hypothetical protein
MNTRTGQQRKGLTALVGSLAVGLAITACGGDDDDAGGDTIDVVVSEWTVEAPATAKAGMVTINASNEGGETHELVVVRADSSAGFVQDDTGKVDEDGFAEGDFIGEITEFEAGTSSSGTFELTPGTYILFCNIVEEETDGTFESHFVEGMQTTLVVE